MSKHNPLTIALAAVIALFALSEPAPASEESDFLAEYAKHEPQLYEQYVKNRRIKVEVTGYGKFEPTGVREGQAEDTIVSRGDAFRANSKMSRLDKPEPYKAGAMWFEDEAYRVSQISGTSYKLDEHYPEATRRHQIEDTASRFKLFLPLSFAGGYRVTYYFAMMDSLRNGKQPRHSEVKAFESVVLHGRPAIRVAVVDSHGATTTSYFDPQNHYAFLEYERDKLFTLKGYKDGKMAGVMTYVDGPEGFPIPKEYKEWFILPGGKRVPREEVVFTEYERYTPTDDDFDLEKQFGIKPFPKAPKPGKLSGGRWGRWLWIAGGVLGLTTLVLIALRWRRRS